MRKNVEYFMSLQSPWTYLGHARLLEIVARQDATVTMKPVSLPALFSATGGQPLAKRGPQRQAYRLLELARWARHLEAPLNLHPAFFPVDERRAQGMVVVLDRSNHDAALKLAGAMLTAVWADERDLANADTLLAIASASGIDGQPLINDGDDEEITGIIERNTQEAIAANVFGVPNYVVSGEPYWGQDRLDFVERALAG